MTEGKRRQEAATLPDVLLAGASDHPGRRAVVFPDASCNYRELLDRARTVAAGLIASGIEPGRNVGLLAHNGVPFLAGLFGISLAGCVVVPINARHRAKEIGYVARDAELAAVLTTSFAGEYASFTDIMVEAIPGLAGAAPDGPLDIADVPHLRLVALLEGEGRPGFVSQAEFQRRASSVAAGEAERRRDGIGGRDVAMILYTSGTTADPKGCLLTHEGLTRGAIDRASRRFRTSDHDVAWNGGPLFHIAAFGPLIGSMGTGGTYLSDLYFEPTRAVALMRREGVTMAWPWFPAIVQRLLDQPDFNAANLPRLKKLMMIVPEALAERVRERFPDADIMQACGMTETSGIFAVSTPDETWAERATTQGKTEAGLECRIVDPETLADLPDDRMGEIWVRGYCVTMGYHNAPAKTAEAITADGWLRTGDLYIRTPAGNLIFKGRHKDMLKVGGENVAAIEVESFLCSHPAVRVAEVVGRPHPELDEVPVAFVELQPGASATAQELIAFCQGRIARYKIPVDVRFVEPDTWPMSATKVNKRALRDTLVAS